MGINLKLVTFQSNGRLGVDEYDKETECLIEIYLMYLSKRCHLNRVCRHLSIHS